MKNGLIYDCEIKHGVETENNPRLKGFTYARDWQDFTGMGISCICAFDFVSGRYRVFLEDNFDEFQDLLSDRSMTAGFNNHRFDAPLLLAHDFELPHRSVDVAEEIWIAAGIPAGEHPRGLGLDAICRANGLATKSLCGSAAPILWQSGNYGSVIDYCLQDVRCTLQLMRHIEETGGVIDPRDPSKRIRVDL